MSRYDDLAKRSRQGYEVTQLKLTRVEETGEYALTAEILEFGDQFQIVLRGELPQSKFLDKGKAAALEAMAQLEKRTAMKFDDESRNLIEGRYK